ncbi:MAG: hypothetical protein CMC82_02595 [Flavobacteriaceae bacterium]|nr:hypothetical protein [Flavobacteriaceae bacterium]|tara:strand:- start:429 stop:641 length:213 start_codon:yes stop_codon:yes gene_type:complete
MTKHKELFSVSTRLSKETYDTLNKLCELTKKPIAAVIDDSLNEYFAQVFNKKYSPSKSLQIDKFAAQLES